MSLSYAIVGYGRMGHAIDRIAESRGHRCIARLGAEPLDAKALGESEIAFEFTRPEAAQANVERLLAAGRSVICGTTGWQPDASIERACREHGVGAIVAPNFSLGMQLFYRISAHAATLFARLEGYEVDLHERHHRGKRDLPSGTALRIADRLEGIRGGPTVVGTPTEPVPPGALHVSASRSGGEPGTHTLTFDGAHDLVTMTHQARDRALFAEGAVVAAEWLAGKVGLYTFEQVVDGLLEDRQE